MPNALMTTDEAARQMANTWTELVNKDREHPLSKSEAIALFGVAFGVLDMPADEVKALMADKPRA